MKFVNGRISFPIWYDHIIVEANCNCINIVATDLPSVADMKFSLQDRMVEKQFWLAIFANNRGR